MTMPIASEPSSAPNVVPVGVGLGRYEADAQAQAFAPGRGSDGFNDGANANAGQATRLVAGGLGSLGWCGRMPVVFAGLVVVMSVLCQVYLNHYV